MIPLVPCDTPEPCCTSMYAMATHLLTEVYDALIGCYPQDCDPLAAYVTMGRGDDGIPDALTVQITDITTAPSSTPGSFGLWRVGFLIILRESGWPVAHVEGQVITLPEPSVQAAAAEHVFAMGEAMHRKLARLYITRSLAPAGTACTNATLSQMAPLNPSGGVVGWTVQVNADLPWN